MRSSVRAVGSFVAVVLMLAATGWSNTYNYTPASGSFTGTNGPTITSGGTAPDGGPGVSFNGDTANFAGGGFTGGVGGYSAGTAPVNQGGNGGPGALATNLSILTINAGNFTGGQAGVAALGTTNIEGNGGSALALQSGSIANIYGGNFTPGNPYNIIIGATNGVAGYSFDLSGGSTLTLYGTFTGAPANPITGGSGSFDGVLQNNGTFSQTFTYNLTGRGNSINLEPAPEPGSIGIFAAGIGAMVLRRRRRD